METRRTISSDGCLEFFNEYTFTKSQSRNPGGDRMDTDEPKVDWCNRFTSDNLSSLYSLMASILERAYFAGEGEKTIDPERAYGPQYGDGDGYLRNFWWWLACGGIPYPQWGSEDKDRPPVCHSRAIMWESVAYAINFILNSGEYKFRAYRPGWFIPEEQTFEWILPELAEWKGIEGIRFSFIPKFALSVDWETTAIPFASFLPDVFSAQGKTPWISSCLNRVLDTIDVKEPGQKISALPRPQTLEDGLVNYLNSIFSSHILTDAEHNPVLWQGPLDNFKFDGRNLCLVNRLVSLMKTSLCYIEDMLVFASATMFKGSIALTFTADFDVSVVYRADMTYSIVEPSDVPVSGFYLSGVYPTVRSIGLSTGYKHLIASIHELKFDKGDGVFDFDYGEKQVASLSEEAILTVIHKHGLSGKITVACEGTLLTSGIEGFGIVYATFKDEHGLTVGDYLEIPLEFDESPVSCRVTLSFVANIDYLYYESRDLETYAIKRFTSPGTNGKATGRVEKNQMLAMASIIVNEGSEEDPGVYINEAKTKTVLYDARVFDTDEYRIESEYAPLVLDKLKSEVIATAGFDPKSGYGGNNLIKPEDIDEAYKDQYLPKTGYTHFYSSYHHIEIKINNGVVESATAIGGSGKLDNISISDVKWYAIPNGGQLQPLGDLPDSKGREIVGSGRIDVLQQVKWKFKNLH